eukprot:278016_1
MGESCADSEIVLLQTVTKATCGSLRKLNNVLFESMRYSDKFYRKLGEEQSDFNQIVLCDGCVVGGMACRLDCVERGSRVYVMTFGVLAPYRRSGIGSRLVEHLLQKSKAFGAKSISLHVHVTNDDALAFYKFHGFSILERISRMYPRLEPPDAYLLVRSVDCDDRPPRISA